MRTRALLIPLALAGSPAAAQLPGAAKPGPDLVVDAQQTAHEIPSAWTVRNAGKGDAGPSILKILVKLRPPEPPAAGGAPPCAAPGKDFIQLIPALRAGEARTVTAASLFPPPAPLPQALRGRGPFVCVYDVRAVADANDDVKETNEANNEAARTVERRL